MFKIKTVRDLSLKEIQRYQKFYKEQEKKKKKTTAKIFPSMVHSKESSQDIVSGVQSSKSCCFWSLRNIELFSEWSDVDIAVLGIKPELYYKAVASVISLSPIFKIDVVDLDDCQESLKRQL